LYRREAEKLKPPAPVYIRVKAAEDRRGLALLGRRGTSEIRTLDPRTPEGVGFTRRPLFKAD